MSEGACREAEGPGPVATLVVDRVEGEGEGVLAACEVTARGGGASAMVDVPAAALGGVTGGERFKVVPEE